MSRPVQWLRSFLRSGRPGALTWWGNPSDGRADVQLFHYEPDAYQGLIVAFARKGDWRIQIGDILAEAEGARQMYVNVPVPSATLLEVGLSGHGFTPSDIRSIAPVSRHADLEPLA